MGHAADVGLPGAPGRRPGRRPDAFGVEPHVGCGCEGDAPRVRRSSRRHTGTGGGVARWRLSPIWPRLRRRPRIARACRPRPSRPRCRRRELRDASRPRTRLQMREHASCPRRRAGAGKTHVRAFVDGSAVGSRLSVRAVDIVAVMGEADRRGRCAVVDANAARLATAATVPPRPLSRYVAVTTGEPAEHHPHNHSLHEAQLQRHRDADRDADLVRRATRRQPHAPSITLKPSPPRLPRAQGARPPRRRARRGRPPSPGSSASGLSGRAWP